MRNKRGLCAPFLISALEAPMNADPTPMAADPYLMVRNIFEQTSFRDLSAAIGVGSAFIGAFKVFHPNHSIRT
jgi:hypothetical protein